MGIRLSRYFKFFRDFNLESRAFKEISKDKPTPAPRYPSTLKYTSKEPEPPVEDKETNKKILEHLKQVYVTSADPEKPRSASDKTDEGKNLPQNRRFVEDPEFGYLEPDMVPEGKLTLRQAVDFIYKHKDDPNQWSAEVIAKDYKIDLGVCQKILHYFKAHELYLPRTEQKTLAAKIFKDLYIPTPIPSPKKKN